MIPHQFRELMRTLFSSYLKEGEGSPWGALMPPFPALMLHKGRTSRVHQEQNVVKSQCYPSSVTKKKAREIIIYVILVQMLDKLALVTSRHVQPCWANRYPWLSTRCLRYRSPSLTTVGRSVARVSELCSHTEVSLPGPYFFLNFLFINLLCLSYHVSWSHPSPLLTK